MAEDEMTVNDVAPLLRGLTFDGEKGAIVLFSDRVVGDREVERGGGVSISLTGVERDRVGERLSGAFAYRRGAAAPRCVACPPLGTFYIGESFDEAAALRDAIEAGKDAPRRHDAARGETAPQAFSVGDRGRVVENKAAIVTGGAQGFGEEIVRYLAQAGCHVFIADLNESGAVKLAEELNSAHGRTCSFAVGVDISSEDSVRQMIDRVVRTLGGIDLFVSNAGVLKAGSVRELAAPDFELVTKVNYTGYFLCVKWASAVMALQNSASGAYYTDIIQINSKSGLEGSNKNGAYAGSKFGGVGLTQSFALELVSDNIKVNAICPGNFLEGPLWSDPDRGLFVQYLRAAKVPGAKNVADVKRYYEGRVPMGRGCSGADVIKAIYYVIEQKYETGQAVPVTGGQVMLS